jgi:hypothetical protein
MRDANGTASRTLSESRSNSDRCGAGAVAAPAADGYEDAAAADADELAGAKADVGAAEAGGEGAAGGEWLGGGDQNRTVA